MTPSSSSTVAHLFSFGSDWKVSENRKEFIRQVSQIVHEWNGHLEICSRPQAIENSSQYLLLQTDIYYFTENSRWVPLIIRGNVSSLIACY